MISYKEALALIYKEAEKINPGIEEVDLINSLNRIAAEDVYADVDIPPFDNSAMDGFAIKYSGERQRKIIGEISAGNYKEFVIENNDAVGITTGSKIPEGADTVVPIEDVIIENEMLIIKEGVVFRKGSNVRPKGSDLLMNSITVSKYSNINPSVIATLASCGKEKIKVFKKLKAGILATGDELIPISEKPCGDKIRASNNYALESALYSIHQEPISCGFLNDDRKAISDKVRDILSTDIDIFITTGGVSVGKYDFLKEVFEESGVEKVFWKVNIKPGMPFYFGVYKAAKRTILVFGLPGNPVSTLVNFHIFIEPSIRKIFHQAEKEYYTAVLQNEIKKSDGKRHFSRGHFCNGTSGIEVKALGSQSSGNYFELAQANCLIITDEEKRNPQKGDTVKCILI